MWSAGVRFAEFNYRAVKALADADDRPRWYTNDYFGDLFAPKALRALRDIHETSLIIQTGIRHRIPGRLRAHLKLPQGGERW